MAQATSTGLVHILKIPLTHIDSHFARDYRFEGSDSLSELKALSKIIQDAINSIEAAIHPQNLECPSPYTPMTIESEAARMLPNVDRACSRIVSAAAQLIFSARSPMLSVMTVAMQVWTALFLCYDL